ncbi:hypothetical protein SARC_03304 [Sphaeroforma arctica JP610]|uniref:Uncharacterized protein n=1 Tax=Sphaeroforma arctica JP610 TaxID=667725 RepID=A0A0L0G6G2_9EUKA|nr:hypothetical protein SARC_03304 [Sphaeroforma arctica JP610]KNC84471.1 hypothetical protein SARC_03304 [Sphaeroforma arctica JP610]|eukprot:XP_014158373.1 hypothetical protein SARC_03304 [Sphaeroforma arctica JP610]
MAAFSPDYTQDLFLSGLPVFYQEQTKGYLLGRSTNSRSIISIQDLCLYVEEWETTNIRPHTVDIVTPATVDHISTQVEALTKRMNVLSSNITAPPARKFQCYVCWSSQHHSDRCTKASGKRGDKTHTSRECTNTDMNCTNCNRSQAPPRTPSHFKRVVKITCIHKLSQHQLNEPQLLMFNSRARQTLTNIELGSFPLQMADESTIIILPHFGMTCINNNIFQQLLSQNLLHDNGFRLAYPANTHTCVITEGLHTITIPGTRGGYHITFDQLNLLYPITANTAHNG